MNYYLSAFHKYFVFTGRATRREYWIFTLFNLMIEVILMTIDKEVLIPLGLPSILTIIYLIIIIIPSISLIVRRTHDIGKNAWWLLATCIPIIGIIILLFITLKESDEDNQYGPKPSI